MFVSIGVRAHSHLSLRACMVLQKFWNFRLSENAFDALLRPFWGSFIIVIVYYIIIVMQ